MPKLKRPDGRIVSVSVKGVGALLARGYTDPAAIPAPPPDVDLEALLRPQLDERARAVGVEEPEKLPNKVAVIAAMREKGSA